MSNIESVNYNVYANYPCRDIPIETLKGFILTFLIDASQDMGTTFDKDTMIDRIYYIINTNYNHLPLSLVASSFKKGALGQYGAGRLVPRTVYGWLGEMNQYFITLHEGKEVIKNDRYMELDKYPLGKAICWKIDHLTEDEWDSVPLKRVAEMIGRGQMPTLADFGIKNEV